MFSPIDIASILPRKDDFLLKPTHLSTVAIDGEEFTKTGTTKYLTTLCAFGSPLGFCALRDHPSDLDMKSLHGLYAL